MNFRFEKNDSGYVDIFDKSNPCGNMKCFLIWPGNSGWCFPLLIKCDSSESSSDGKLEVLFSRPEENLDVKLELELKNHSTAMVGVIRVTGQGSAIIRLVWELPRNEKGFSFIPAFMYGRNRGGNHPMATYPQLSDGSKEKYPHPWVADEWQVRADRSSHCLSSIVCDDKTIALGGRDVCRYQDGTVAEKNGLGVSSTSPQRISFSLGFANAPYTYSVLAGRNFISRPEGYINLDKGPVESKFFLLSFKHPTRSKATTELLRQSYDILHDSVNDPGRTTNQAIDDVADALVSYGYCPEAKNFYTTFAETKPDSHDPSCRFFTSGWAGGSEPAYPLLAAGYTRGRQDWIDCARTILNNFAENSISPRSGLFYDNYDLTTGQWNTKGWWSLGEGHSGYVNGHLCHYLLKGYLLEKENGTDQPKWLGAVRKVLDKIAATQGDDGRLGYYYSEEDGSITDGVGFAGCWFVPAFANLYKITKEEKYLNAARRAMEFYRNDVETFEVFGCPHDTFKSPDGEGILAWIASAKLLHEITEEKIFLDDLLKGLNYEFSWKFAYNVINEVEPLKSLGWCSTGGSVTSVNNSHIHPMGSATIENIHYAWQQTGDDYFKSRLDDTIRWTLNAYLHHDGQFGWGRKGMINERYCYTDSLLLERFPDGSPASTWFCGHSWASGSVLEGLVAEHSEYKK